jgi:hypothetical protein
MIDVCKHHNLISKEHNGDYIPVSVIKEKFDVGLNSINIAPEFGLIETQTYLDNISDEKTLREFWQICYDSGKWIKWVDNEFDPHKNKIELIKICGHYVLSSERFFVIKKNFTYIDEEIKLKGFIPGSNKYKLEGDLAINGHKSNLDKGKRKLMTDDIANF